LVTRWFNSIERNPATKGAKMNLASGRSLASVSSWQRFGSVTASFTVRGSVTWRLIGNFVDKRFRRPAPNTDHEHESLRLGYDSPSDKTTSKARCKASSGPPFPPLANCCKCPTNDRTFATHSINQPFCFVTGGLMLPYHPSHAHTIDAVSLPYQASSREVPPSLSSWCTLLRCYRFSPARLTATTPKRPDFREHCRVDTFDMAISGRAIGVESNDQ